MAATVSERRLLALRSKLSVLQLETTAWRQDSQNAAARFALHHSQIAEVCEGIDELHKLLSKEVDDLQPDAPLAVVESLERRILAAVQIWDTYRAKWSLRVQATLRQTLDLIDDLAWQAYRPAHDLALASGWLPAQRARLPPLVFTNPRWSPFARSRERGYELDEGSGLLQEIDDFEPYLRTMPVPLIGIPWTQAGHLPDAVFVGHEVGHLIEDDLGLEGTLSSLVDAALPEADEARRQAWSVHWRSEVFADVWGVLCCGPAFAETLVDLLIGSADVGTQVQPDAFGRWGSYPTHALRVGALVAAVRALDEPEVPGGFALAADRLAARWQQAHPGPHAMPAFDDDAKAVVKALMGQPLAAFKRTREGDPLPVRQVLRFTRQMQDDAEKDATEALALHPPLSSDVRTLFAGQAIAYARDPAAFAQREVQQRFIGRLLQRRTQGLRAKEMAGLQAVRPDEDDRRAAAASAFRALFDPPAGR
ncbi:hypothetical protein [Ideonella sp. YS5]|uniref:hypothetical protein n=1 Tax=Ideonella sp. YS5 TaxID=3453714 RepID=UPI003EF01C85